MASISSRVYESLQKLNELGQLLLVINNLRGISEDERNSFKQKAIKKDPTMIAALEEFKLDKNPEKLVQKWRNQPQEQSLGKKDLINYFSKKLNLGKKADSLAEKCLNELGKQTVSKKEFKTWASVIKDPKRALASTPIKSTVKKYISEAEKKAKVKKNDLLSLRDQLDLADMDARKVVARVKHHIKEKSGLSQEEFVQIMLDLISPNVEGWTKMRKSQSLKILFKVLDFNRNESLEKEEIVNALIVLCGGSQEDKIRSVFDLYDVNGDGFISQNELLEHQKTVFRIMFTSNPSLYKKSGESPDSLAHITVESIFQQFDDNGDQLLTFEEFKAWYEQSDLSEESKQEKIAKVQAFNERKEATMKKLKETEEAICSPEHLKNVKIAKTMSKLEKVHVFDALTMFRESTCSGFYTRFQFAEIIVKLIKKYVDENLEDKKLEKISYTMFQRFDQDNNGVVDMKELFSGLSLLCGGSLGEKIHAACSLHDESGDGNFQFEELKKYFEWAFEVVLKDDISSEVTHEKLAEATAKNLFSFANQDTETGHIKQQDIMSWVHQSHKNFF